jgi:hypothetical protein
MPPVGRAWVYAMLVALAVTALAGCGGGDSGPGASEEEINIVLTTFFTSADPSQCDLLTQKALQQIAPSAARADDPATACREEVKASSGQTAKSINADLDVDGSNAKASVTPDGGIFAGLSVDVALVDDNGWKIDGLGMSHLVDRDIYLSALESGAGQGQLGNGAITPKDARCMAGQIDKNVPEDELRSDIEQDNKDFFYEAIKDCMGGGQDFIAIVALATNQLEAAGLSTRDAQCVAALTLAGPKNLTVKQFAEDDELKRKLENTIRKGAFLCNPESEPGEGP